MNKPTFRPGDRARDRRTGEFVTIGHAQIVAYIDGLADEFVFNPADLEPLDSIDEQCARALARIAVAVARSGQSEAAVAERIGMTGDELRDALAGRREFLVREVLLLERVAGLPLGSLFDDEDPAERIVRRAKSAPIRVQEMGEVTIPPHVDRSAPEDDDEPGIEWPIRCERCNALCAISAYPPPPMTAYCPSCSRRA